MKFVKWDDLPEQMQTEEVKEYYDVLKKKKCSMLSKRLFDIVASLIMLAILSPVFLILLIAIKIDSKGPVFYRQVRLTQNMKPFRIHKFRTMRVGSDKESQITLDHDDRVTKIGKVLRKFRLDEIPQLLDVLSGNMTFVGTRPEVPKYVELYTPEMMATLLLPAGITSEASIYFKDEASMLQDVDNADETYVNKIVPIKMYYNLRALKKFNFWKDLSVMFKTVLAVLGKDYVDKDRVEDIHYENKSSSDGRKADH